ncbi:unnamed protein product [Sympodiomycopsis kandeliae]
MASPRIEMDEDSSAASSFEFSDYEVSSQDGAYHEDQPDEHMPDAPSPETEHNSSIIKWTQDVNDTASAKDIPNLGQGPDSAFSSFDFDQGHDHNQDPSRWNASQTEQVRPSPAFYPDTNRSSSQPQATYVPSSSNTRSGSAASSLTFSSKSQAANEGRGYQADFVDDREASQIELDGNEADSGEDTEDEEGSQVEDADSTFDRIARQRRIRERRGAQKAIRGVNNARSKLKPYPAASESALDSDASDSSAASSISFSRSKADGGSTSSPKQVKPSIQPVSQAFDSLPPPADEPTRFARPPPTKTNASLHSPIGSSNVAISRTAASYFQAAAQNAQTRCVHQGERFSRRLKSKNQTKVAIQEREAKKGRKRATKGTAATSHSKKRKLSGLDLVLTKEFGFQDQKHTHHDAYELSWLQEDMQRVVSHHRDEQQRIKWDQCMLDTDGPCDILQEAMRWRIASERHGFNHT